MIHLANYDNFATTFFRKERMCRCVVEFSECCAEEVVSFFCHSAFLLAKHHWQSALPAGWGFWSRPLLVQAKPPDRPCRVWPYPVGFRGTSAHFSEVLGHSVPPGNLLQLRWSSNIFLMKMVHIKHILWFLHHSLPKCIAQLYSNIYFTWPLRKQAAYMHATRGLIRST